MIKNKTILVAGGDLRQLHLATLLAKDNNVISIGFGNTENKGIKSSNFNSLQSIDIEFDYIILPMPVSNDDIKINASFSNEDIFIDDILSLATRNSLILGGKLSDKLVKKLDHLRLDYVDYLEREELAVLNAIPTAEGAIQLAMQEMPITIFSSKILLIGYGRISKVLARILKEMNADVTVSARKYSDLAWIDANGYKKIETSNIINIINDFDLIINTVPVTVLKEKELSLVNKDCLIIDLASKPGGIDFETAKQLGLKTIWALSLPGKVAPITAGKIIYTTISNIENERGHNLE